VNPLLFFGLLLRASLFSTSGMGNLPMLHADLLARRWVTEAHFVEALAVGQLSPGPTGLWVVSLGYLVDGLRGALLATVAIVLPPFLVLVVDRLYQRVKDHPAVEGFVWGMGLAVVGVFAVALADIWRHVGVSAWTACIVLASFGLGMVRRVPVVVVLGLAALAGIVNR
jgi:chromate transporter